MSILTQSLKSKDLVVAREASIKCDSDIKVDPELVSVLQVEPDGAPGNKEIDVETNTVLEVSKDVADVDSNNTDGDSNFIRVGVDVAGDLAIVSPVQT